MLRLLGRNMTGKLLMDVRVFNNALLSGAPQRHFLLSILILQGDP
jgi:hypothetical protein